MTTVILIFLFLIILSYRKAKKKEQLNTKLNNKITELLEQHKVALARQRMLLVQKDVYGVERIERWEKEKDYFFSNVMLKDSEFVRLLRLAYPQEYDGKIKVIDIIEWAAKESLPGLSITNKDMESLTPYEFEYYCADIMRKAGWDASVTQAAGDQGVDVIASKEGVRVVLQCKKYSSPVGNKAVQEIAAGKIHQQAQHAAVVTNNAYTPSAKQLASTTGVYLLHITELEAFAKEILEEPVYAQSEVQQSLFTEPLCSHLPVVSIDRLVSDASGAPNRTIE